MGKVSPAKADDLASLIAPVLVGSPFERRRVWPNAVVVLRRENKLVTSRGDFAGWLAANDLGAQARECIARRVPRGHVLVWIEVDVPEVAVAGFVLFDLASALRREG